MYVVTGGATFALATGASTRAESAKASAIQHPIRRPRERNGLAEPFMACISILLIRAESARSEFAPAQPQQWNCSLSDNPQPTCVRLQNVTSIAKGASPCQVRFIGTRRAPSRRA